MGGPRLLRCTVNAPDGNEVPVQIRYRMDESGEDGIVISSLMVWEAGEERYSDMTESIRRRGPDGEMGVPWLGTAVRQAAVEDYLQSEHVEADHE